MRILIDSDLTIELITTAHQDELMNVVNANRAYLREWLIGLDVLKNDFDFHQFVKRATEKNDSGEECSCVILENGKIIGRIGLYEIDRLNNSASIGYWVTEETQGRGIITRACEAILNFAFEKLQLNRVEIRCAAENARSSAIPKRLGFQREGIIRQGELLNGVYIDLYLYSMLKEDWRGDAFRRE